jgi:hypothetical protein
MQQHHAVSLKLGQGTAEAATLEITREEGAAAIQDVTIYCRAPQVHEAWRRCSSGVFTTCPMCDRDSLSDRPLTHH